MKYVPGPFVGELSGSQGNTTAAHNVAGPYLRNRTIPVNPNTPAQATRRNNFQEVSSRYRGLTALQQQGWITLGQTWPIVDSLGQSHPRTGLQAFMAQNLVRRLFAQPDIDDAPILSLVNILTSLSGSFALAVPTASIAFTPTPIGANIRMLIWTTGNHSPGVNFYKDADYRLLAATAANVASPVDVLAAFQLRFGNPIVGASVGVKASLVNQDFFVGTDMRVRSIVAP